MFLNFMLDIDIGVEIAIFFEGFVFSKLPNPFLVLLINQVLFLGRGIDLMIYVVSLVLKNCQFSFFINFLICFLFIIFNLLITFILDSVHLNLNID